MLLLMSDSKLLFLWFLDLKSSTGNIALRRTAIQSSTYLNQTAADLAVDGNKNKYSRTDCKKAPDEWLAVDLGGRYNISHVVVTNRRDCCGISSNYTTNIKLVCSCAPCSCHSYFIQWHWV